MSSFKVKFVLLLLFVAGCGSQVTKKDEKKAPNRNSNTHLTKSTKRVTKNGLHFEYITDSRVHYSLENGENNTPLHNIYIEQAKGEEAYEIFISQINFSEKQELSDSMLDVMKGFLKDALSNSSIKPLVDKDLHQIASNNSTLTGYFADFTRTYAPQRHERLAYLCDKKRLREFYVRIKVNSTTTTSAPLSRSSLAGQVYDSILRSLNLF